MSDRLDALEAQNQSARDALPAVAADAPGENAVSTLPAADAAALQTRYNDLAESLRLLQSQTDKLILQMRSLQNTIERTGADNEFRFRCWCGVRRANTGISSTSDASEVIGYVKRAAPIAEMAGASAPMLLRSERLVGEGDLSVLQGFGDAGRTPLGDPKALYERAMKDLQAGNYAGGRGRFRGNYWHRASGIIWPVTRNIGSVKHIMCAANTSKRRKPFCRRLYDLRNSKKAADSL